MYSAARVAQHTQLAQDLQKSNARASHIILRLGGMRLQHHQFKSLCEEFVSLVRLMTLQIFLCEQVAGSGVREHYDVINVILGTTCDYCLENGKTRKLQNNEPQLKVLRPNQAWAIQVEGLSELMISVARNVSEASFLPKRTVEQSIRSLAVLSKVLSRQRRHLEQFSVRRPTEIRVIGKRSDVCPDCGQPHTAIATDE
jgi:hypothetical protein